jgi:hypothetical protein
MAAVAAVEVAARGAREGWIETRTVKSPFTSRGD